MDLIFCEHNSLLHCMLDTALNVKLGADLNVKLGAALNVKDAALNVKLGAQWDQSPTSCDGICPINRNIEPPPMLVKMYAISVHDFDSPVGNNESADWFSTYLCLMDYRKKVSGTSADYLKQKHFKA